jgi:hypothetical protein
MEEDEVIGEFEVSFNYKNVLYVCQIQPVNGEDGNYYKVEYFSPNGKGIISKLVAGVSPSGSNRKYWQAPENSSDAEFLQILGQNIERSEL